MVGGRLKAGKAERVGTALRLGSQQDFGFLLLMCRGAEPGAAETFPSLGGGQNPGAVFIKFPASSSGY